MKLPPINLNSLSARIGFVLLIVFGVNFSLSAQEIIEKRCTVHFASDEFVLDADDKAQLNEFLQQTNGIAHYELEIQAHTDHDGSKKYNQELADKRANAVRNYLKTQNLVDNELKVLSHGELKPLASNVTETGKKLNRRVELNLRLFHFNSVDDLLTYAKKDLVQVKHLEKGQNEIKGKGGTSFFIPDNSFCLPDGTPVDNEKVRFEFQEVLGQKAAILNEYATMSDGKLIQSGGMFEMRAFAEGQELGLRENASIDVALPSEPTAQDMTVFTPVTNTNTGIVEWSNSNASFVRAEGETFKGLAYKIDLKELRKFMVDLPPMPSGNASKIDLTVPELNHLPREPRYPRSPRLATEEQQYSAFQRFFIPKKIREKRVKAINQRRVDAWETRKARYQMKMARYQKALKEYKEEYAAFDQKKADFYQSVCELEGKMIQSRNAYKAYYDRKKWNGAIRTLMKYVREEKKTKAKPEQILALVSSYRGGAGYNRLNEMNSRISFLNHISSLRMEEIQGLYTDEKAKLDYIRFIDYFFTTKGNRLRKKKNITLNHQLVYWSTYSRNDFADAQMKDPKLAYLLDESYAEAYNDLLKTNASAGDVVQYVYRASLSNMGAFNCDRFSNIPPARMAKVKLKKKKQRASTRTVICFEDKKGTSTLYPYYEMDGTPYVSVPIGQKLKVVDITTMDGKVFFDRKDVLVKRRNAPVEMKLGKQVTVKSLALELEKL